MKDSREIKETIEHDKYIYDNEIKPITLCIDRNIWNEFKKRVPRHTTLNHAIQGIIAKFVFIEKGDFNKLNLNELYGEILKDENNAILIYGEDSSGKKIGGKFVKCNECSYIGEIGQEIFSGLCQDCGEKKSKKVKRGRTTSRKIRRK